MTKYGPEARQALVAAPGADEATARTVAEWTERARAVTAFVTANLPPDLPPITTYISSIEGRGAAEGAGDD